MKRTLLILAFLVAIWHRLPAPIQEFPESPTPAPEKSAKPKPKRTIKPKVASDSSESSTKRQTPSPLQSKATPQRNLFEGTWLGTLKGLPFAGDVNYTLTINSAGTVANEKSTTFGSLSWPATCDGVTTRGKSGG